ncbi:MAG: hypothetical protein H5T86_05690, partial [Armatimonadetes bacterium]|nr:hypothetical protein [Armatimonadota bacterium]
MPWRLMTSVALAVAIGCAAAAEAPEARRSPERNLVPNGDFELAGTGDMPSAWFPRIVGAPEGMVSVKRGKGGYQSEWCLQLSSEAPKVLYGAYCQPIDLPPEAQELLISFRYRTRDLPQPDVY